MRVLLLVVWQLTLRVRLLLAIGLWRRILRLLPLVLARILPAERIPRLLLIGHDAFPCTAPVPCSPGSGDALEAPRVCRECKSDVVP